MFLLLLLGACNFGARRLGAGLSMSLVRFHPYFHCHRQTFEAFARGVHIACSVILA